MSAQKALRGSETETSELLEVLQRIVFPIDIPSKINDFFLYLIADDPLFGSAGGPNANSGDDGFMFESSNYCKY